MLQVCGQTQLRCPTPLVVCLSVKRERSKAKIFYCGKLPLSHAAQHSDSEDGCGACPLSPSRSPPLIWSIGPSRYAADSTAKNVFMASLLALLIPLQVQCADSHPDELNTNYNSAEVVSIMWQVSFLPAKPIMKET